MPASWLQMPATNCKLIANTSCVKFLPVRRKVDVLVSSDMQCTLQWICITCWIRLLVHDIMNIIIMPSIYTIMKWYTDTNNVQIMYVSEEFMSWICLPFTHLFIWPIYILWGSRKLYKKAFKGHVLYCYSALATYTSILLSCTILYPHSTLSIKLY